MTSAATPRRSALSDSLYNGISATSVGTLSSISPLPEDDFELDDVVNNAKTSHSTASQHVSHEGRLSSDFGAAGGAGPAPPVPLRRGTSQLKPRTTLLPSHPPLPPTATSCPSLPRSTSSATMSPDDDYSMQIRRMSTIHLAAHHPAPMHLESTQLYPQAVWGTMSLPVGPRPAAAAAAVLHLPASLQSTDSVSPRLWTWIHGPDQRAPYDPYLPGSPLAAAASTEQERHAVHVAERERVRDVNVLDSAKETKVVAADGTVLPGIAERLKSLSGMPPPAVFAGGPGPVPLAGATSTSFPLAAAAVDGAPPPYIAVRQQPRQRKPVDSGESVVPKYMVTAALPTAHAKSKRKPQPKSYDIPRLLIQVVEVRVKTTTNALHAHFTLQMGSKKIWSTPVLLEKESRQGLGLVAVPREAFLFDISPDLDLSDLNVPILLTLVDGVPPPIEQRIAAHQASADCAHRRQPSPTPSARSGFSTNTVNSVKSVFNRFLKGGSNNGSGLPRSTTSTSGLCDAGSGVAAAAAESAEADVERSRSGTGKWLASALGRPLAKMGVKGGATPKRATGAAAGGAVGSAVIGEVAFGVPRDLRDSEKSTKCIKLYPTGTGRAASTRKGQAMVETAQVVFQIGLIWDEQFPPPVKEPVVEHSDYLNFQVNSKSGAIWKRYWVVLKDACLDIYNFEYKESKPAISALELSDNLIEVSHADPEVVCAPHCTQLRFVDLERVPPSGPDQLEGDEASVWRQSILDPEYQLAFVTADSKEQMLEWQTVLTMHARKRS